MKNIWDLVFGSYLKVVDEVHGLDRDTRDIAYSQELLDSLHINVSKWPVVTVTGSKGKGSVAVLLASILGASGERVGLVTSPHMRSFNERIRVDGRCVTNDELDQAAREIAPEVNKIRKRIKPPHYLGPGGVILALTYKIFAKRNVSVVVIEAGRGGEFDEARLVNAKVSVLTPIMLEHADKLGPGVADIAGAKAMITAPGSIIISSPQSSVVRKVIKQKAVYLGSEVKEVGIDAVIKKKNQEGKGVTCDISMGKDIFPDLYINLGGIHQAENAATAILAANALTKFGVKCTMAGIYKGLKRVSWPGRAQILQKKPWVFLDGAINEISAKFACDVVRRYPARNILAIIAVPRPKDIKGVFREVSKLTQRVICTEVINPELVWYENAEEIASDYFDEVQKVSNAKDAFKNVMFNAKSDDGMLLLGTQSFLREALEFWDIDTCRIWQVV